MLDAAGISYHIGLDEGRQGRSTPGVQVGLARLACSACACRAPGHIRTACVAVRARGGTGGQRRSGAAAQATGKTQGRDTTSASGKVRGKEGRKAAAAE